MKKYKPNNFDPFTDLLFNVLLGFKAMDYLTLRKFIRIILQLFHPLKDISLKDIKLDHVRHMGTSLPEYVLHKEKHN